jgi:hypothetical protein
VFGDTGTSPLYTLKTVLDVTGGAHRESEAMRWSTSGSAQNAPRANSESSVQNCTFLVSKNHSSIALRILAT